MNRRTFGKLIGAGVAVSMAELAPFLQVSTMANQTEGSRAKWPTETYRRLIVDMHVPDWDPVLMSRFDAESFVTMIADAGFQSILMYAVSEVGLCFYPSKIGPVHAVLKGRDFFGEVVEQSHRHGLNVLGYVSLMFDNMSYQNHPDWRILPEYGENQLLEGSEGRYGVVCPNSPYRDYATAIVKEIAGNYDIEGMFLDQIIWPAICYCPYCTARFWREYNHEPPRVVDWDDPTWRHFQDMRDQSIIDLVQVVYQAIKQARSITVCPQYAGTHGSWTWRTPLEVNRAADYAGGDFYAGPGEYSLDCKYFDSLTRTHPYEFMISAAYDLRSRLSLKPYDQLLMESLFSALHCAPFMTIDGILPDGTLYEPFYKVFRKVNDVLAQYDPFIVGGGEPLADVAIYWDQKSMYNPAEKGDVRFLKAANEVPHWDAVFGIGQILRAAHIPFGIITNISLDQLEKYRCVVVPNVFELTADQAGQFRRFVEQGGTLYASGPSSLDRFDPQGPRFLLEDVLGVRYKGTVGTVYTYFTPEDEKVKEAIWPQLHIKFVGPMIKGEALPGSQVLATVTLPYPPIESEHVIGSHFTDIESDQPAQTPGSDPALVKHSFGKGQAVWLAAPLESNHYGYEESNGRLVSYILRRVFPGPYWFEVDTHPSVEMTLYHQRDKKRLLAGLLNLPQQLPPIPVGATVRVQVPSGQRVKRVVSVPQGTMIPFEKAGVYTQFRVEPFEALAMALIEYE